MKRSEVPSLKSRLVTSALVMLFVLLPAIGLTLDNAFGKHLLKAVEQELTAHSYSILAETDYIDGELLTPTNFLESQFNVIDSGLYALITELNLALANESKTASVNEIPKHCRFERTKQPYLAF